MAKMGLSIVEAAAFSGVGRSKIFEEIREGRLPARKAGRRTIILQEDVQKWVTSLPMISPRAS